MCVCVRAQYGISGNARLISVDRDGRQTISTDDLRDDSVDRIIHLDVVRKICF